MSRTPVLRPGAGRATREHIAYVRAITEGVPMGVAAARHLGVETDRQVPHAHHAVMDLVRSLARKNHDPRWRLLGLHIPSEAAADTRPNIDEWAESEGLTGWSAIELQDMYAERFGARDKSAKRRQARNARLRVQRSALLSDLETTTTTRARPTDLVEGWVDDALVEPLRRAGLLTLGDLQGRIAVGGRWWVGVIPWGPTRAQRLAQHVGELLGTPSGRWDVEGAKDALERLTGERGSNRGQAESALDANCDAAAVRKWIEARTGSPETARNYRTEADRWRLFLALERGRSMADATVDDCTAYIAFLANIPPQWICHTKALHMSKGWAPFRGQLRLASRKRSINILHSMHRWLRETGYLAINPWALIRRKLGDDPNAAPEIDSRSFTPACWDAIQAEIEYGLQSAEPMDLRSAQRLRWHFGFTALTGLRGAEVLRAVRADFLYTADGYLINVFGKGQKSRLVPVPSPAMDLTRAYFAARGHEFDSADPDMHVMPNLRDDGKRATYSALASTVAAFLKRVRRRLSADEVALLRSASTHWLRHTYATRGVALGLPDDVLLGNLGHIDPRTRSRYARA